MIIKLSIAIVCLSMSTLCAKQYTDLFGNTYSYTETQSVSQESEEEKELKNSVKRQKSLENLTKSFDRKEEPSGRMLASKIENIKRIALNLAGTTITPQMRNSL